MKLGELAVNTFVGFGAVVLTILVFISAVALIIGTVTTVILCALRFFDAAYTMSLITIGGITGVIIAAIFEAVMETLE